MPFWCALYCSQIKLYDFVAIQHLAQHSDLVVAGNSRVVVDLNGLVTSEFLGILGYLRAADHMVKDLPFPL